MALYIPGQQKQTNPYDIQQGACQKHMKAEGMDVKAVGCKKQGSYYYQDDDLGQRIGKSHRGSERRANVRVS
jgi:hypothetical protein